MKHSSWLDSYGSCSATLLEKLQQHFTLYDGKHMFRSGVQLCCCGVQGVFQVVCACHQRVGKTLKGPGITDWILTELTNPFPFFLGREFTSAF